MFCLTITVNFEAAHRIIGYPGKCSRLHGHNWKVDVRVSGTKLNELGMLIDFRELKTIVSAVINRLDHQYLNELPAFKDMSPTAEHIARYFFQGIAGQLPDGIKLETVDVWESDHSVASYQED